MAEHSAKPTVLQIIDHLGPGGAQRQFVELTLGLHTRGYPVLVCTLDDGKHAFLPPLQEQGVPIHQISQSGKLDLSALRALRALIRETSPQIIQTWLFTADMYGRIAAGLHNLGKRNKARVICSIRSAETDKKSHYVWVDRALRFLTDKFIVNAAVLGDMLQAREKVSAEKILTIYNGINYDYFAADLPGAETSAEKIRVGFIGRLSPEKRPDLFIQAAQLLLNENPELEFTLIGSGDREHYQKQIEALGLESKVFIRGFSDDIAPVLRSFTALVSCSEYEGCSNTILEAMAAGVAVVASSVGGNPELIRDRYGWLVPADDAQAIAAALQECLDDEAKRHQRVSAAQARVADEFTQANMIRQHEVLYQELLS